MDRWWGRSIGQHGDRPWVQLDRPRSVVAGNRTRDLQVFSLMLLLAELQPPGGSNGNRTLDLLLRE